MKTASIALLSLLLAPPLFADAGDHIIPAGSLVNCTISEPRISSKTTAVGDPVLCTLGLSERYGRSMMPYHSYLVGRFEDYKDPGHFVGKGWMVLKFDRMVIEPRTVIPVDARVVDVPGYKVDNQGRILGKGHVARDITLWAIPILWPIDLLMLPMRGPRPTLKHETHLTLKIMEDMEVPEGGQPQVDPYGLSHRPVAENQLPPPPQDYSDQPAPPQQAYAAPPADDQPQQDYAYAPPPPAVQVYAAPMAYGVPPVAVYGYNYGGGASVGISGAYRGAVRAGVVAMRPRGYGYAPRAAYPGTRAYGASAARGVGYAAPARAYAASARAYSAPRGYAGGGYGGGGARAFSGGGGFGGRGGGGGRR
jgi:hypothetical protein